MTHASVLPLALRTLPLPLRVLLTAFLLTVGIGFLAALYLIYLQDVDPHREMGMGSVAAITEKYYGNRSNSRLESALRGAMADRVAPADRDVILAWLARGARAEDFAAIEPILDRNCNTCHRPTSGLPIPPLTTQEEVQALATVDKGISLLGLARVSHVHLFGISILFLLTGTIFALSRFPARWRLTIMVLPFVAMWADIASWWLTRYEPVFAYVVVAGGALMGVALAAQIILSLWELWLAPAPTSQSCAAPCQ